MNLQHVPSRAVSFVRISCWRTLVAAAAAVLVTGCGGESTEPDRYPVSGTVSYNGEPLSRGIVSFYPEGEAGRPAFAELSRDGSFELSTFENNDGAVPGVYKVTVQVPESPGPLVPPPVTTDEGEFLASETAPEADAEATADSPEPPAEAAAAAQAKPPIPLKYTDRETTPLTFEVTTEQNKAELILTDE